MNVKRGRSYVDRKDADVWTYERPVTDKLIAGKTNHARDENNYGLRMNKQSEILPGKIYQESQGEETAVDSCEQILYGSPESKSQHPLKRYSRTQSATIVGIRPVASSAKLKRVLSASEIRTRLAGCPQGLLIATEPPKSGESYRRRSYTDVKAALGRNANSRSINHETSGNVDQDYPNFQQERETILLELETVKQERQQLQQENERLQQELENRNKVIDHLIDFMKSAIPAGTQQISEDFTDTLSNNNLNRMQSFEKV